MPSRNVRDGGALMEGGFNEQKLLQQRKSAINARLDKLGVLRVNYERFLGNFQRRYDLAISDESNNIDPRKMMIKVEFMRKELGNIAIESRLLHSELSQIETRLEELSSASDLLER